MAERHSGFRKSGAGLGMGAGKEPFWDSNPRGVVAKGDDEPRFRGVSPLDSVSTMEQNESGVISRRSVMGLGAVGLSSVRPLSGIEPLPLEPQLEPFMLWIDSVGGYLVLPQSRVVIGQADPGRRVDVPIVAGIEGRHLELIRERETYVVVPHGSVSIGERRLTGPESLA